MKKYIVTLDQGTTSSRALVFDSNVNVLGTANKGFRQIYPNPGWVEHDPVEIYDTQLEVLKSAIEKTGIAPSEILSVGIANQRETVVLWDKRTGKPVYNAIVWQCRRTAGMCLDLKQNGMAEPIRQKTGLLADAYFSGTKIKWILENVEGVRKEALNGNILAGTVDTWLIWNFTRGRVHATDYSNASRTLLFNIHTLDWDEELLEMLDIPRNILPEIKPTSSIFGCIDRAVFGCEIPIASAAGDQQAALFGQTCFEEGDVKNTYGTGCFMLMNTGREPVMSEKGLLTTVAWGLKGKVTYALEGSIFIGGAVIQWLRDELGLIKTARECDLLAETVADTNGVYFVPAFVGLGTPYWDMYARGALLGLTRGANRAHISRAALEAIAYQVKDVLGCMQEDSKCRLKSLKVDGGASVSNILMQFQADILGVDVYRPHIVETTAMGAAFLAGIETGFWSGMEEVASKWKTDCIYHARMNPEKSEQLYSGWKRAVERSLRWEKV